MALVTDLDKGDIGESRFQIRADSRDDPVQVRSTWDGLGDILGTHVLGRRRETGWCRQVRVDRPASGEPAELVMSPLHRGIPVRIPAHRDLSDHPPLGQDAGGMTALLPAFDDRPVGCDVDQVIGCHGKFVDGLLTGHRHRDGQRDIRQIPDAA